MDLEKLRSFSIVVETGSIRKAAELLRVSPPALSKTIRTLEESLDVKLIVPSGRGISITDAGMAVAQRSRRLLADYEQFVNETQRRGQGSQTLRIGTFEIFSTHFLGWAIEHYLSDRNIVVREVVPAEIEAALLKREVDVGITYIPVPNAELDFIQIANQEMGIFGRVDKFKNQDLDQIPFCIPLTPVSGSAMSVQGLDGWPMTGPSRNIRFQVQMLETALNIAARGQGVVFCPAFLIKLYNDTVRPEFRLSRIQPPKQMKPVEMNIYLVKRKSDVENSDIRILAKALRRACS